MMTEQYTVWSQDSRDEYCSIHYPWSNEKYYEHGKYYEQYGLMNCMVSWWLGTVWSHDDYFSRWLSHDEYECNWNDSRYYYVHVCIHVLYAYMYCTSPSDSQVQLHVWLNHWMTPITMIPHCTVPARLCIPYLIAQLNSMYQYSNI